MPRGGKREGSGRKPKLDDNGLPKLKVNLRVFREDWEYLTKKALEQGMTVGEYITKAVKEIKGESNMDKMYMHKETGSVDTKEGWVYSYNEDELEIRGFENGYEAFEADEGVTLIEVKKSLSGDWIEVGSQEELIDIAKNAIIAKLNLTQSIEHYEDCGYLTEHYQNGKTYIWYYDGNTDLCIEVESMSEVNASDIGLCD